MANTFSSINDMMIITAAWNIDDSDKKNGCYIVSDGTIRFKAYVSDATYRKDDQVRVSVLNGDFSEKKFILQEFVSGVNLSSSILASKSDAKTIIGIIILVSELASSAVFSSSPPKNGNRFWK